VNRTHPMDAAGNAAPRRDPKQGSRLTSSADPQEKNTNFKPLGEAHVVNYQTSCWIVAGEWTSSAWIGKSAPSQWWSPAKPYAVLPVEWSCCAFWTRVSVGLGNIFKSL